MKMPKKSPAFSAMLAAIAVLFASPAAATPPLPPSPAVTPGAAVVVSNAANTDGSTCTLGWLAHDATGRPVALTAGHCDFGGSVSMKLAASGAYETIGDFSQAVHDGGVGEDSDMGLISLTNPGIAGDSRVLDRRPVEGVTAEVKEGDVLCKYGFVTGRKCGPVTAVTPTKVVFGAPAEAGDSGGPVYLVQPDGDATAVGIAIRGDDSGSVAELVQPWLQKWQLTLDTKLVTGAQPVGYGG